MALEQMQTLQRIGQIGEIRVKRTPARRRADIVSAHKTLVIAKRGAAWVVQQAQRRGAVGDCELVPSTRFRRSSTT
jgi:hypothetical protein